MLRRLTASGRLALTIVLILASAVIADALLRGTRIDLTERGLFTVSPATRELARDIETPIRLRLYFSRTTARSNPNTKMLLDYAATARDLIDSIVAANPDMLSVEEVDPLPFSEAEDEAGLAGLQAVPLGVTGENLYLGLVAETADGRSKQLPFLQPERHTRLEYEIARMLIDLARPGRPVVGIYSELPFESEFDFQARRERPGMLALTQLREQYDLQVVDPNAEPLSPDTLDLLLVVHPKSITPLGEYRIEQYLLAGGHALVFLDVDAQADVLRSPGLPAMPNPKRSSTLPTLLAHWGIGFDPTARFADREAALQVSVPGVDMPMRHLAIVGLEPAAAAAELPPLTDLQQLVLVESGHLASDPDAELSIVPLLQGGEENGTLPVSEAPQTPQLMNAEFRLASEPLTLAALIRGEVTTAFPGGAPVPAEEVVAAEDAGATAADTDASAGAAEPLADQDTPPQPAPVDAPKHLDNGPIAVALFADTDLLANTSWVNLQSFMGRDVAVPFASNGDLVANLVDWLGSGDGLIGIRGREQFARPFDRVLQLQRQAEERYLAQQQALETELQQLESRLMALESQRDDSDGATLSEAQVSELERFQLRRVEIRRELRAVQRELTQEIEALGTTLKFLNIIALPLLLVGALALVMRRLLGRWPV